MLYICSSSTGIPTAAPVSPRLLLLQSPSAVITLGHINPHYNRRQRHPPWCCVIMPVPLVPLAPPPSCDVCGMSNVPPLPWPGNPIALTFDVGAMSSDSSPRRGL